VLSLLGLALAGELHLVAVDPFGRPVDATWTLESGETLEQGTLSVPPGHYRLAVTAEGFFGTTVDVDVGEQGASEVQAVLAASQVTLTDRRIVIHDTIHFETNRAVIKPESYELLRQIARVIIEHPEVLLVSIEGHADERGSDEHNLDLSRRRAASVRQFLIEAGVSPVRLVSEGFGESKPLVEGSDEEAWSQNRRVEFVIVDRAD
jgi:outer membrane protein OmpA-like peptidoglycan-associated protein